MHAREKCPSIFLHVYLALLLSSAGGQLAKPSSQLITLPGALPSIECMLTCTCVHTWKFMWSQSTSSRHWQDFLAMDLDGALKQHASRVVSFLGTISPLGRCSCAAALSSLVRSSNTMECFLLVPLPFTFSFFTTKSSPSGAGTGFNCSEDRM